MQKEGLTLKNQLKGAGIEINEVAKTLGMTRQNLGYHFRKDRLDRDFKEKLLKVYGSVLQMENENYNSQTEEINTHKADNISSLNSDESDSNRFVAQQKRQYKKEIPPIPMYPHSGTAGEVEVYNDTAAEGPAFYVSIPQFRDCKFGKSVYGHSMYPTITSGSYVFCKPVSEKTRYIPGEIYYIEYDNFGVCKRLQHGPNPDEVLLVSDNDELRNDGTRRYESYVIKIDQIRQLFLVKGFFNQNHN